MAGSRRLTAEEAMQHVINTYARAQVAELDYLRALREAAQGMTLDEIATQFPGVGRSELANELSQAHKLAPVPQGFSGASPFELCQRYAIGELTETGLIEQLSRWKYATLPATKVPTIATVPGSIQDLDRARRRHLINSRLYAKLTTT